MTFTESVKICLGPKYFFRFQGRASRSEYWWFMLFNFLVNCASAIFFLFPFTLAIILNMLLSLALLPANLGVTVRRLHDRNLSGWWVLVPVVLVFLSGLSEGNILASLLSLAICIGYLIIFCLPGQPSPNRYGPDPL